MEKTKRISRKEFVKGYLIELCCCMCWDEQVLAACTKKELDDLLKEKGWKELDSDEYGVSGYWCGCEYRDAT